MSNVDDEPPVLGAGCGLSPLPNEEEFKEAYFRLYAARWDERGFDESWAKAWFDDHDFNDIRQTPPKDQADTDMEYLDSE